VNVVDSSGWLEYFTDGVHADFFAGAIEDTKQLVVPSICIYEVFKYLLARRGLATAQIFVADMMLGYVVDIDTEAALSAAKISVDLKMPMTDSLILAVARSLTATLWSQDEHFRGLENVRFIQK
jgi:predicted nucleic acid-binding protein